MTNSDPLLAEVIEREQRMRLRMAHEHLALSDEVKAQRAELDELHATLRESLTEVHTLNQLLERRDAQIQTRHADLELFVRHLAIAEDRAAQAESRIAALRQQTAWQRLKKAPPRPAPVAAPAPAVPGLDARYFLHNSPYRFLRDVAFTLRGWAWPEDGRAVTGVRVRIDGEPHAGTWGLPEAEALRVHGDQPRNPLPGFSVEFPTPAGRHNLALDLELGTEGWFVILQTPIWGIRPN